MDKKVSVTGKVEKIITDRTKWKSYLPEVTFDNLFITFQLPSDEAVVDDDGNVTVTLDGFAMSILDPFATAVEKMHNEWQEREDLRQSKLIADAIKKQGGK